MYAAIAAPTTPRTDHNQTRPFFEEGVEESAFVATVRVRSFRVEGCASSGDGSAATGGRDRLIL
ncbi:hypothetical protein GCM10027079_22250 [Sediminivirga luteola]|uniref:Uncharacterized protein n=1 Tax=Sediminivirga luteola TaxID=1774748 RepID=A0A8J2XK65_9MICO|nr:hypothetical protein GCM10011333_07350 [Sediminivirga luteola]